MYASDLKHSHPALEEKLHTLYNLKRNKKIDLSFRPDYLRLLEVFGQPHLHLPPTIHVAGTNGKGSIIAVMRSVLEQGGYSVHTYTSPHLCAFNERIVLAGREIDDSALESLIDEALDLNQGRNVTFFEITTAMAFAAFSRIKADALLLETGLGGRLDCTNIITGPKACIIHTISCDHMDMLGETLPQIAAEKAGIMKPGIPCIIGPQTTEDVMRVFERKAEETGSPLYRYGREWFVEHQDGQLVFTFEGRQSFSPLPALPGAHQIGNTGAALAALHALARDIPLRKSDMDSGLQNAKWRGRLQNLTTMSREKLPPGWELWLDVGHNEGAGQALAGQMLAWRKQDEKPLYLIMGMLAHKDARGFLEPLLPHVKNVRIIGIPGEPKSFGAADLAETVEDLAPPGKILQAESFESAVRDICGSGPGRILAAGSLYLAGHILRNCCYNEGKAGS